MTLHVETTAFRSSGSTLASLVSLAARTQSLPSTHIAYFGTEPANIAAELAGVHEFEARTAVTVCAGDTVGWLTGEADDESGRVWWWGPVVAPDHDWPTVADALYDLARRLLPPSVDEEELAADDRHRLLSAFAARHGFTAEEASLALEWQPEPTDPDPRVRRFEPGDADAVARLHDHAFPGTHFSGAQVASGDFHPVVLVIDGDAAPAGYIAIEIEADGKGYIDFLGVDEAVRGSGCGRALLSSALHELSRQGVPGAHLTVRESNVPARRLYAAANFTEATLLRPYRKGFLLDR